jgi:hypothetical protein
VTSTADVDERRDWAWEQVALVDVLDRVLATGVVIDGDITLSIAGVDLCRISLRALIASIRPETGGRVP